jgi:hypothetical protein
MVKHFFTPGQVVKDLVILSDSKVLLVVELPKEEARESKNGNKVIASFVTAYGRCLLYKAVNKLGDKILYMDTDSVLFAQEIGTELLPVGDQLGQLGDELEAYGDGSYIQAYAAAGAKNYAYRVATPQSDGSLKFTEVRKLKGFTLCFDTANSTTLEKLKELIDGDRDIDVINQKNQIVRGKQFDILSKDVEKKMKCTLNKRIQFYDSTYSSIPYGTVTEMVDVPYQLPDKYLQI